MDRFLAIHKFGDADAEELDIKLRAMKGRESLSELFNFKLFADLPQDKVEALSAEDILGKRVIFSIHQPESPLVFFSGIMSTMSLGNISKEHRRSCNFEVVPELWKLTETLDTRRHPSDKVVDLVSNVLEERQLDLKLVNLVTSDSKRHPERVNPVQYEETYYDFLLRHMKEEGIYFFHREQYVEDNGQITGDQTLVLGDDARGFFTRDPEIELRFQLMENVSNVFDVRTWDRQFNFKPAKWTINDYDYQKADDFAMTRGSRAGRKEFRKFKSHAGFYSKDYADQMLANLAEREDVNREYILATSNCPYLAPGCRFKLKGHPVKSENGEYIVTAVEHRAFEDLYGSNAETEYENRFTCVPAKRIPTCCPHTGDGVARKWPQPQLIGKSAGAAFDSSTAFADVEFDSGMVLGPAAADTLAAGIVAESAWVVDSNGSYTDAATKGTVHARQSGGHPTGIAEVQVRFTWETTDPTDTSKSLWQSSSDVTTSTRWVRVSQLAAGQDWGAKFIPRVGEEVIVLYLDGAKKKPVIVGSLFNSSNNTTNMLDRLTDQLQIVSGQGGTAEVDGAWSIPKPYGVASSPANHDLVEGLQDEKRPVPNLRDDDVSGIRTRSASTSDTAADGLRFNEILFKDKRNEEELYMHAARDFNVDVENDMHVVVHGDMHEVIHGKYYRCVNIDPTTKNGVNRSIVGNDSFDLDRVWEYKAVEGTDHPLKVKTEVYADTETSTKGDVKEVQWGTSSSYFLGNTWEMNVAAAESLTLGFTLDIFIGAKVELCAALSFTACAAASIELTAAAKLEVSCGPTLDKSPVSVDVSNVNVERRGITLEQAISSFRKDKLHVVESDVIILKGKLIVLDSQVILQKGTVVVPP
ncbi:MAG: contractile injection system protein, VgrG/Pvc8 family [Pirellulaceae bacterium]